MLKYNPRSQFRFCAVCWEGEYDKTKQNKTKTPLPINLLYRKPMIFSKLPIYLNKKADLSKLNPAIGLYWYRILDVLKIFCWFTSVSLLG